MQYHKEPPFARFTYEPDGTVQVVQDLRCISCQGPLTQNNWRRDGGSIPQCDSCANYTKMNGIRGLPSSNSTKSSSGTSRRVSTTSSSSKVGIPQCRNVRNFLPFRFFVKSMILGIWSLNISKLILGLVNFCNLTFTHLKIQTQSLLPAKTVPTHNCRFWASGKSKIDFT